MAMPWSVDQCDAAASSAATVELDDQDQGDLEDRNKRNEVVNDDQEMCSVRFQHKSALFMSMTPVSRKGASHPPPHLRGGGGGGRT